MRFRISGEPSNTYLAMGAICILTLHGHLVPARLHAEEVGKARHEDIRSSNRRALRDRHRCPTLLGTLTVTMIAFTGEETHANIKLNQNTGVYVNKKMVHAIRGVLPEDIAEPVNKHFETLHFGSSENTAEQPEPTAEED